MDGRDFSAHFVPESLPSRLRRLADAAEAAGVVSVDVYGASPGLQSFEAELAALLGKELGAFFPTGTLAQRAALHSHREQLASPSGRILVHPTSHLVHHDCLRDGPAQAKRARVEAETRLPAFPVELVGDFHRALALEDFGSHVLACGDVVVVEIPQRMNGGRTMPWADLEALSGRARDAGARLHMDGARLWEVQPYYGRSLADICRLFDSVYVSFYKGLGGTCGAMLCGHSSLVRIAKAWLVRLGGSMFTLAPHWLDAQLQLRAHRGGFEARFERLREVVHALSGDPVVSKILRFEPPSPQSCLVHGYIASKAPRDVVEAAHERVASATGSRLWNTLRGAGYGGDGAPSGEVYFEWNMGPANSNISTDAFLKGWRALSTELSSCT